MFSVTLPWCRAEHYFCVFAWGHEKSQNSYLSGTCRRILLMASPANRSKKFLSSQYCFFLLCVVSWQIAVWAKQKLETSQRKFPAAISTIQTDLISFQKEILRKPVRVLQLSFSKPTPKAKLQGEVYVPLVLSSVTNLTFQLTKRNSFHQRQSQVRRINCFSALLHNNAHFTERSTGACSV